MERNPIIAIVGPTASGKTARAVAVARAANGEIISADSRQLYRGMDIGTGKDLDEYGDVSYHLIDIQSAGYRYNLHEYLRDFALAEADIRSRSKRPIVCGGTGLYVESVLNGIALPEVPENPELRARLEGLSLAELTEMLARMKRLHNTTDVDTAKRAIRAIEIATYYQDHPDAAEQARPKPREAVVVGIDIPREQRRQRISERLRARLEQGMVDEVRRLISEGVDPEDLIYYGLEYRYVTEYVVGRLSYDEMYRRLEIAIHQFAKRQMTWFRGMERRCHQIVWLPWDIPADEFTEAVLAL